MTLTSLPAAEADTHLQALIPEIAANLEQHILAPWYPRVATDAAMAGFRQEYDERWRPGEDSVRSVVYQARLTWVAARAVRHLPARREEFARYARHGVAFLNGPLRDREYGGLFWQVGTKSGGPDTDRGGEKHAYGLAFALYAAAAAHEATGDPAALELAQHVFAWLEAHAHDAAHGGYYEALTREGRPIVDPRSGDPAAIDAIGTCYGFKSMNTHLHLLEALAELAKVWPDPAVMARLREVFGIVRDTIAVTPPGCLNLFFTPDWRPVPDHDSFGHDVEAAYLLAEAAEVLGIPDDPATWAVARALVDHALAFGWDTAHGGFYDHGSAFRPATGREKIWWTQAEGLNALLLLHDRFGREDPRYAIAFRRQWEFIRRHQTDEESGGWRAMVEPDGKPIPGLAKSDAWTDPYHQGRALMNVLDRLRATRE